MAKKSSIYRNKKRIKLVDQYADKRAALKETIRTGSPADKEEAMLKLQALPKNSAPTRVRNRCALTGRPRGVYRKFGLGRNKLREMALKGQLPGVTKASW